jgi:hypothetical protein
MGNTNQNWPGNTTYIYTGYVWNNTGADATWTFAKSFDDAIYLVINGDVVLDHIAWAQSVKANYTLKPGANAFEVRFGQGGGGVGPVANQSGQWWSTTDFGFGYDPLGRDVADTAFYQPMIDPGDGSLFTLTASRDDTFDVITHSSGIIVDAGATLDLGGARIPFRDVSGEGTIANGTALISAGLMPGGNGAIGTLTFNANLTATGTYHADVLPDGASDLVVVNGDVDLSQLALNIVDPEQLSRSKTYTILTAASTITGTFASDNFPSGMWQIRYTSNTVKIVPCGGTVILIR